MNSVIIMLLQYQYSAVIILVSHVGTKIISLYSNSPGLASLFLAMPPHKNKKVFFAQKRVGEINSVRITQRQ